MKNILLLTLAISFGFSMSSAQKTWVPLASENPKPCKPQLISSNDNVTEVEFNLPGFFLEQKNTPNGIAYSLSLPGSAKMLQTGMPDLAQLTFSLVIPDDAEMKAEVISSAYIDYSYSIAPSKGNLYRNINPDDVPYSYDVYDKFIRDSYQVTATSGFYPAERTMMREPYILRDYRGQTVVVYPFSYNPVRQILRVYTQIKIKVSPTAGTSTKNTFMRRNPVTTIDPVFAGIYNNHFLNVPNVYTPLYEHGRMLVISDSSLMSTMQAFVNWKNRMGQPTDMVDLNTIGSYPGDIKNYIQSYYNTLGLTFVLLVGDGAQIPPFPTGSGDSDPSYGYLNGSDSYAEVFVGRFSANTPDELLTQVERTINYELSPEINGHWYHKAICIASDQGPGDDNEMDFEHEQNIRADLMNYTYTVTDELYDGSQGGQDDSGDPDPNDLINSINAGRSLISYTGHGSSASLGTTGFSSSDISSLTNNNRLPYIFSVACVNGNFNGNTCLAEELMRSKNVSNGKATGAIATLMSTINQSWDPPMDAQDEMIDLLVETYPTNIKHTFGGISVNGCMHMNDEYGTAGDEMTDTWTIFGDPSLMIRTNTPQPLFVSHAPVIDVNAISFSVTCSTNNAMACLSHNNQIISSSFVFSGSSFHNVTGLQLGDTLDLTITAYNAIPYTGQVIVTSSTGIGQVTSKPYVIYPNPSNGSFNITLANGVESVFARLVNSAGQIIMASNLSTGKIDVSNLPSGIYSLSVVDSKGNTNTDRIVIY